MEIPATAGSEASANQLKRIWQDVLGLDSVDVDQNYFDLGGDSSTAVQMFAQIQQVFNVKLPLVTLYEAPTILELLRILQAEQTPATGWNPLVPIQPTGTRPPFFCFHGAGGNVLIYRKLAQYLGPEQPFYGLQSRGMDGVDAPLTTIQEMAALYLTFIRSVQPRGPYFLAGYCMGGTVAYEAAQQLLKSGESVGLLALLDTMNWHKIPLTFWSRTSHDAQRIWFHVATFFNLDFTDMIKFFREKKEVLRNRIPVWRGLVKAAFSRSGAGDDASNSLVLGRIWKTNDLACWNYIPEPYAGHILDVRPARQYRVFSKPDLKWDKLAQGGQQVVVLPVYPAGMLVEPFVKHLASALTAAMDDVIRQRKGKTV